MSFLHIIKSSLFIFTLMMCTSIPGLSASTRIYDLRVEYLINPVGIDVDSPRFSWKMESDSKGVSQTGYQIVVSTDESGENIYWNSGEIESGKSVHILYDGTALQPSTRYYWLVNVWDNNGNMLSSSEKGYFETGLFNSGWSDAQWIKSIKEKTEADVVLQITDYVFEVDFQIENFATGFVFGYQDDNNFFMWQINLEKSPGKTMFRPHTWRNRVVACHEDKDITALVDIKKGETHSLRIVVNGNNAKTYIDNILVDNRTNPHGGDYGYGLVGFRLDKSEYSPNGEEAYFDNVSVTSPDGSTMYFEEDFSDVNNFLFSNGVVREGRLHILGYLDRPKSMQQIESLPTVNFDLEVDLTLIKDNANVIFGAVDMNNYLMWQINTTNAAQPMLRRHFYKGGAPTTSQINFGGSFSKADILNNELPLKIEVRGKSIKTYLGGKLIDDFTHTDYLSTVRGIGFRAFKDNLVNEIAYYDNVILTSFVDGLPEIIYSEDFEGKGLVFEQYETIDVNGNNKLKMFSLNNEARIFDESKYGIPMFRTEFNLNRAVRRARLYASSLGVNDLFINGERVGTRADDGNVVFDELKPGWTNYSKTVFYNTYDVTGLLSEGVNAMGALVSSGWWTGDVAKGEYGSPALGLIAKLSVEYSDGTVETIVTNTDSWKTSNEGAIRLGDIYAGEFYDARRESNWSEVGFDDSAWLPTTENRDFKGEIKAFVGPNVHVRPELEQIPLSVTIYDGRVPDAKGYGLVSIVDQKPGNEKVELAKGDTAVYDMGQNLVGWVKFKIKGKAGTRVTLRFAEMLNDDGSTARVNDGPGGSLYRIILRGAKATLDYVLKGDPDGEVFSPSMTFYGFRYCDVVSTDSVKIEYLRGEVVGTVAEEGSSFVTSHEKVNKLYQNILWGQRGNFLSVPTDCPQRDERLGWTGDLLAFGHAATFNADVSAFFHKWMGDVRDGQRNDGAYYDLAPRVWGNEVGNAGWAEAGVVIPWVTYLMYGNKGILEENFVSMERFMTQRATQVFDGYKYNGGGIQHGDWLAPEGNEPSKKRFIAVCFYAYSALLMEKISYALSQETTDLYAQKARSYKTLYENIKAEFQTRYVNANGSLKERGQTAYLLALKLDLFPNNAAKVQAVNYLDNIITNNGNKLGTGFVGTAILNQVLSEVGLTNTAYNLLLQRNNPSWLYSVDQGATTIWERWNGYTNESGFHPSVSMNSFNHYAYGAVSEWMYRYMAGINPDVENPGFKHVLITPHPDMRTSFPAGQERINSVDATYNSYYGKIRSAWSFDNQNLITYTMSIPANTTATVVLSSYGTNDDVFVNGVPADEAEGVTSFTRNDGKIIIEIVSGDYNFFVSPKTGIQKVEDKNSTWTISPNPVKSMLTILGDDKIDSVRIFEMAGRMVYVQDHNNPINMGSLCSGVYMLELSSISKTEKMLVIKE